MITLESLLIDDAQMEKDTAVAIEPSEAAMECADVYAELAEIEMNITNFEAAKIIKKSKSNKKKVKVAKSKMKASDAKKKKAAGKVVKVTKVTKEGDADVDGGTGPLPTTTDTNGLTDTDLDADPDAEVEVTEVVDDGTPQEEIVGTEGADFMIEYEDAAILTLEAGAEEQKKNFGEKLKALWDKIMQFIKSCIAKIVEFFNFDKKFLDANKEAIVKGLASDAKVSGKAATYAKATVATSEDAEASISPWAKVAESAKALEADFQKACADDAALEALQKKVEDIKSGNAEEAKNAKDADEADIKSLGLSFDQIYGFVTEGKKTFNDIKAAASKAASEAIKAAEKGDARARARQASAAYQKAVSKTFAVYGKLRGAAMTVAKAAAKAGEAAAEPEKK